VAAASRRHRTPELTGGEVTRLRQRPPMTPEHAALRYAPLMSRGAGPNTAVFDPSVPVPAVPELVSLEQHVRDVKLVVALGVKASSHTKARNRLARSPRFFSVRWRQLEFVEPDQRDGTPCPTESDHARLVWSATALRLDGAE
jgi:hypothetical protein